MFRNKPPVPGWCVGWVNSTTTTTTAKERNSMSAPITLIGRLGADPELKYTQGGMAVVNLNIVTNIRKKDGDQWVDADTTWWRVTVFRQLAENVAESLTKGDEAIIVGKVKSRSWEDPKSGEKRTSFEVTADQVGASLGRSTAAISRVQRSSAANTHSIADDPWANDAPETPAPF